MPADKEITATLLDATYIGQRTVCWIPGERYRLRAIRKSLSRNVHIQLDETTYITKSYLSDADFYAEWSDVKKLGTKVWKVE